MHTIKREFAYFDSPVLGRASVRRRIRNDCKRDLRRQLRNNSMLLAARQYLLQWRQKLESEGHTEDPTHIRKLGDIESETNEYYTSGRAETDLRDILALVNKACIVEPVEQKRVHSATTLRLHDATTLAWEFALYGEGRQKPTLRLNSGIWQALDIDPEELDAMAPEEVALLGWSRLEGLLGLDGGPTKIANLRLLLKWVVRTHLPAEEEPETTPEAISKAMEAGLIHKGIETRDNETGEVTEVDIKDPHAADFIYEVEAGGDAGRRENFAKLAGIDLADFTPGELERIDSYLDLCDMDYQKSSKTGVSFKDYFQDTSDSEKTQRSRLWKKIRTLAKPST